MRVLFCCVRVKMKYLAVTAVVVVSVILLVSTGKRVPPTTVHSIRSIRRSSDPKPVRRSTVPPPVRNKMPLHLKLEEIKPGVLSVVNEAYRPWLQNECRPLKRLLARKDLAQKRILQTVDKISKNFAMSTNEKKYQIQAFRILSMELNETTSGVLGSLKWLESVLKGDLRNFVTLQERSKVRLETLRDAALKEEQEYKEIVEAQIALDKINHTDVHGVMDQILADVAKAADELEHSLNENLFNDAIKDQKLGGGGNIETVIKLRSEDDPKVPAQSEKNGTASGKEGGKEDGAREEGVVKLVDSKDNTFVLSKGSDTTVPHEDHHLIKDVIYLQFISFLLGYVCHLLTLPTMFGYIVAGILLGPSGFNFLQSLVQLETLGEFGVFFILFSVGLEFSPQQLKKVFKVASLGTILMTLLSIVCGVGIGRLVNATTNESVFVAACLSLSSTPLVVKFLSPSTTTETSAQYPSPSNTDYGSVLMGILVMQDVLLGLLMAVLPNMASAATNQNTDNIESGSDTFVTYSLIGLRMLGALALVVIMTVVVSRYVIGQLYTYLANQGSREIMVLFTITLAFTVLTITDILDISMELGCFLAGVMVSAQGHHRVEQVESLIQPVKDFLACIFFASIGLHVFPTFLAYQLTFLTTLTLAVVGGKYLLSVLVLAVLTRNQTSPSSPHIKWLVSAGLAQVSEFSFVLGSRARRLGLISREVYLLILSVTTLSLLFAPVLWKSTLWRLRIKHNNVKLTSVASQVLHTPAGTPTEESSHMITPYEPRKISLIPQ